MLNHAGKGRGEPLVLIHSIGSHWQMWSPVLDRLAPGRDVPAVDLPGDDPLRGAAVLLEGCSAR